MQRLPSNISKLQKHKMEIHDISNESIKLPSHLPTNPFKISVTDQLYPPSLYSSLILFYPSSPNIDTSSSQLKTSLAKTIIPFYPIAASAQDNNVVIDNFEKGVRFIETRVVQVTSLSEYLRQPKIETLEVLLPCESFKALAEPPEEQVVVQLNRFDCGGIGLGICFSHRIIDATTINAFLTTWAAYNTQLYFPRGNHEKEIEHPDLSTASQYFPPQQNVNLSQESNSISNEISFRKKRFVFSAEAIDNLKLLCKSKAVEKPSRVEALTAFIWKSLAYASASASAKASSIFQAVNIRNRTNPQLPKNTVGSLILLAFMCHDKGGEMELAELVRLQRETVSNFDNIQSGEIDLVKEKEKFKEMALGKRENYAFSSWLGLGFHEINFGWGKPAWVAIPGVTSSNSTFFNELGANTNAVEAWITAKEEQMSVLEKDPEFLEFATPNPSILLD